MQKSGGILGIIGGVLGIFAAIVEIMVGGMAEAVNGSSLALTLGGLGIAFSVLTIIFGAMALSSAKAGGIGLVVCSILGALLGGTFVAVFMVLSLVGGIFALLGGRAKPVMQGPPSELASDSHVTIERTQESGIEHTPRL